MFRLVRLASDRFRFDQVQLGRIGLKLEDDQPVPGGDQAGHRPADVGGEVGPGRGTGPGFEGMVAEVGLGQVDTSGGREGPRKRGDEGAGIVPRRRQAPLLDPRHRAEAAQYALTVPSGFRTRSAASTPTGWRPVRSAAV
jgi:hypothetical protein